MKLKKNIQTQSVLNAAAQCPSGSTKKRYSRRTLQKLGGYLLHEKWLLAVAVFCTFGSNTFALIGPRLTGFAIGAIEGGRGAVDFSRVFYYARYDRGAV